MQQFTVPQFIDIEDKIIGALTVRQFLIMSTGFAFIVLAYKLLIFSAFLVVGVFIFIFFGAFAFIKVNGMPLHFFVLNFIDTLKRPSLRVWSNAYHENLKLVEDVDKNDTTLNNYSYKIPVKSKYSNSRLNELSLIVDTKGIYKGEDY